VLSGAAQGLLSALIVFPIAAVVHAQGVHAHLSFHWWIVVTLIPLSCLVMTSLGLLLGTTFEARNIGLMFGFVVLLTQVSHMHLYVIYPVLIGFLALFLGLGLRNFRRKVLS
jgi:ABC-2 type transport system permease protein